ncbi:MAG: transcriptional repressor [Clostridia bacterium]|nr:transcriptional repressor [Clostridia bacterium]
MKDNKSSKIANEETKVHYKTKQRDLIIEYFKKSKRKHITADDIITHFKNKNIPVSKATVYRSLDMLVKENIITKYMIDEKVQACYSYQEHSCDKNNHYHLRCNECDKVFHIDNEEFTKMSNKIKKEFDFDIDVSKTVLYGKCKECKNKHKKENNK